MAGVELTRIVNVQITGIDLLDSLEEAMSKEDAAKVIQSRMKDCLMADDVLVIDIKDFVREIPDADM